MKMRARRHHRGPATQPASYYVSIPRRFGRSQLLATASTHITINGVRYLLDRPRTALADDDVVIDAAIVVGTERGPQAYAMHDFQPTSSGQKIEP